MTAEKAILATSQQTSTPVVWTVDPAHSSAEFAVRHLMIATVKGRFDIRSGTIRVAGGDAASAVIEADIDSASVDTRAADRDAHLRSADFFDSENHPSIAFRSAGVESLGDDRYRIEGDLTIRGVTRPVVLDAEAGGEATDPWGNKRAGFEATTTIDRREFGLVWNQALEAGGFLVGDKVKVTLHVSLVQAKTEPSA